MIYRDVIFSLFSNSIIRVGSMLIGMMLNIYIVRLLGADEAGKYYFLIGLVGTISSISTLGLNNWLIKELTRKNNNHYIANNLLINVLIRVLIFSLFVIFFMWFFSGNILSWLNRYGLEKQLLLLLPLIVILAFKPYIVVVYQASEKIKLASFFQSVMIPLVTLIVLFYIKVSFSYEMVNVYVISVSLAITFILTHYIYSFGTSIKFKLKGIKGFGSFFSLHLIYNITPLYLLFVNGYFLSNSEFAVYNASFRITVLASFLLIVFNFVSAPKYSRFYNDGKFDELISYTQLITKIIFMLLLPVLVVIFFSSNFIMSWYGPEFKEYGYILVILFIGQFSNAIFGSAGYILTLTGYEKKLKNWNFAVMPVNFCISFIFLYFYGLTGAAVATTVTTMISNFISYGLVFNKLGFSIIKLT